MSQKCFVHVKDGVTTWYSDPEMKIRHRVDGPAVESPNGSQHWYQNGLLHRLDGPANELDSGYRRWSQNGQLHRLDGPAVEYHGGHREWHQNGKRHRLDGPAVEHPDGRKEYWIAGKRVSARQFTKLAGEFSQHGLREMTMAELEAALGHPVKIIK